MKTKESFKQYLLVSEDGRMSTEDEEAIVAFVPQQLSSSSSPSESTELFDDDPVSSNEPVTESRR